MLHITTSKPIPDHTFLVPQDVEPTYHEAEQQLTISTATGPQHPSGTTACTSTVVLHDLVAIHIRFCHRHGTGQFWRSFQRQESHYKRVLCNSLRTSDRLRILAAYQRDAPPFAALPGKQQTMARTHVSAC